MGNVLVQQMCGNGASASGGSQQQSPVRSWNGITPGADGDIKAKAADIGAALAGLNIQTVTKAYRQYVATEGHEDITPMGYLWTRGKGSRFLRAEDGIHFVSCVDVSNALKARLYIHIPAEEEETEPEQEPEQEPQENGGLLLGADGETGDGEPAGPRITGGIYLNNIQLAGLTSPENLSRLILLLGNSPIATAADIEAAVSGLATQEELETELQTAINALSTLFSEGISAAISGIWGNVTDGWEASEQRSSIPEGSSAMHYMRTYLRTIEEDGRYYIDSELGKAYMHRETVGVNVYTWFWLMPAAATDKLNFEYWLNDKRVLGTSSGDGTLRIDVCGKTVAYKDEVQRLFGSKPTMQQVTEEINSKINGVLDDYDPLNVIRTRIDMFKRHPNILKISLEGMKGINLEEHQPVLQLWVCSKKHGTASHWWHPSQPGSSTHGPCLGYAGIAGEKIYTHDPDLTARFPPVPAWMPNGGWMKTEVPITANDIANGHIDLDATKYFLPMIKPRSTVWRYADLYFMMCQRERPGDTRSRYCVQVCWKVAVLKNGKYHTVGTCENIARVGFRRGLGGTLIEGTAKNKKITGLYLSIK